MTAIRATPAMTAEMAAQNMWDRSRPVVEEFTNGVIREVVNKLGLYGSIEEAAKLTVSRFQSKKGRLVEAIVAEEAGNFLHAYTSVQVKTKRDDRVPFDVCLGLPRLYVACSITTNPQERKDETWPGEERHLRERRKELAGQRDIRYVGILVMAGKGATLDQTRKLVQRKQQLLLGGRILALQDVESTAEWLRDVLKSGV